MPYKSKDRIFPFTSPCNLPHPVDLQHPLPHRLTQIISVEGVSAAGEYYCHSDSTTHIHKHGECVECYSTSCCFCFIMLTLLQTYSQQRTSNLWYKEWKCTLPVSQNFFLISHIHSACEISVKKHFTGSLDVPKVSTLFSGLKYSSVRKHVFLFMYFDLYVFIHTPNPMLCGVLTILHNDY